MKTYYAACAVIYKEDKDSQEYTECYSFIITAKNKTKARTDAKHKALTEFESELGKSWDAKAVVDDIYETTSDARAN